MMAKPRQTQASNMTYQVSLLITDDVPILTGLGSYKIASTVPSTISHRFTGDTIIAVERPKSSKCFHFKRIRTSAWHERMAAHSWAYCMRDVLFFFGNH
jgi:hypothetical protein